MQYKDFIVVLVFFYFCVGQFFREVVKIYFFFVILVLCFECFGIFVLVLYVNIYGYVYVNYQYILFILRI